MTYFHYRLGVGLGGGYGSPTGVLESTFGRLGGQHFSTCDRNFLVALGDRRFSLRVILRHARGVFCLWSLFGSLVSNVAFAGGEQSEPYWQGARTQLDLKTQ